MEREVLLLRASSVAEDQNEGPDLLLSNWSANSYRLRRRRRR